MAGACVVTLLLSVTLSCFFVTVTGVRCVSCTYQRAGPDGTRDLECVNDPFNFIQTSNISCNFATHSCYIRAVYESSNYAYVESLIRTCLATPSSLPPDECDSSSLKPVCVSYCRADLCNDGNGDLNSVIQGSSGVASLGLNMALRVLYIVAVYFVFC